MQTDFEIKADLIARKLPRAYMEDRFAEIEQDLTELQQLALTVDEKFTVQGKLASHYAFQRDWPKTEAALQERAGLDSARVEGWLGLAEHFHYYNEDLRLASHYVEQALVAALAAKELVRQVLGVRIRISLALGNHPIVEQSLQMLVEYSCPPGGLDVAFESDFISLIPDGAVSPELIARYKILIGA